ncbi:hypothetical protein Tsp_01741 [Trichinella spiralis]|uniref:hypothetical protein n=1 Tax=Trichinella spiralis TaxID=6334 RepID=UPI0001EFCA7E|nr:hypothetical protein Tsp_01741 [Trichinella spiralis]
MDSRGIGVHDDNNVQICEIYTFYDKLRQHAYDGTVSPWHKSTPHPSSRPVFVQQFHCHHHLWLRPCLEWNWIRSLLPIHPRMRIIPFQRIRWYFQRRRRCRTTAA